MKKQLLLCCVMLLSFMAIAQNEKDFGTIVNFNLKNFQNNSLKAVSNNGLVSKFSANFPLPNGTIGAFTFNETLISSQKIANIQTFDAVSGDGKIKMKLTITNNGMEGIMHTPEGYFFIEPLDASKDQYRIYNASDVKNANISCGYNEADFQPNKNGRMLSIAPFPVGTQLRKYKLAAAATGEMTGYYGSQANALAKIVSIANATNLIYELEAAMTFELATETTNLTIIFSNPATDPFGTISANDCQTSFIAMNTSGTLPYASYGIGHTFNTLAALGGGSYSSNGVAGPTPCIDTQKARGFTQWTYDAPVSMIVGVFAHEVGHQFSAPHTYNATGGTAGSPTFCTSGWSSTSAIEPGSGTTLMSYHNNCVNPTNYTNSGNNKLQYFNTKSLEFIFNAVNGSSGTCITSVATGNAAPVANAGSDITIPKGTPFSLNGSATDANGDAMTYTWEQYDVATANDAGAFGSSINGTGGYPAVNSTTAPLFRSEQSSSSTARTFPKMTYITNNANNPADNEGEDLPQVARTMKFRFTVRDNKTGGGGVDSDEMVVTVDNSGPFLLTSQNTATLWIYNGTNTADITWSVNGTNAAPLNVTNVKISFSTDGGTTFPITLVASTPNDGSHTITIPNNITTQGRIKIEPTNTSSFFDLNNVNITITNTCSPEATNISPTTSLSALAGDPSLNLGLSSYGSAITSFSGTLSTSSSAGNLSFEGPTGSCSGPSNNNYYAVHTFQVVSTASYTFTRTGSSLVMNLYSAAYNPSSVCSNWIGSSGKQSTSGGPVSTNSTLTKTLSPGIYYIVISTFSTSIPTLPINYTITPSGGSIYNIAPASGSPYAYTYLVRNNGSGNITAFSDNSDLSNATNFPAGNYTVYGFSYQGGLNLSSYIGTSFTTFQSLLPTTVCGALSSNSRSITINGNCSSTLALSGAATAGTQQASQTITSTQTIANGVNVTYRAGNSITLTPLSGSGFSAANGSVFQTQIGGCN